MNTEYTIYAYCISQCVTLFQSHERAVDISPVKGKKVTESLHSECFVMAMNCFVALMTQAIFIRAPVTVPLDHFIDPAVTDRNALHCNGDDFCQNKG